MLTDTVIKVTFGDLRAQQIRVIIFQCGTLYHTEFNFPSLFIHRRQRKNFTIKMYIENLKYITYNANDKAVSEPVCLADKRGKTASRSQSIILLRTYWQRVTEFMVPLRINVTVEFLT